MSAYSYAGQSIRIAHCLGLDRPAPASLSNLEREHRKRVWWTAFCVDRAISTELGLRPAYVGVGGDLDYPSSNGLTAEEKEEFYDPDLLTAQIKLCEIKCAVVDTVSQLKSKDIAGPYQVLGQCLQRLDRCGREMPEKVFAGSDSSPSPPERRICASIALRFHQVCSLYLPSLSCRLHPFLSATSYFFDLFSSTSLRSCFGLKPSPLSQMSFAQLTIFVFMRRGAMLSSCSRTRSRET